MGGPSYWEAIAESPNRVTFRWVTGGEVPTDFCCGNNFSYMVRHNRPWAAAGAPILANQIPTQLIGRIDPEFWSVFVADVKKQAATFPPICRAFIFSVLYDGCKHLSYYRRTKENMEKIANDHAEAFHSRGIAISAFDMSGYYWVTSFARAQYAKHYVYGFHLDIVGTNTHIPSTFEARGNLQMAPLTSVEAATMEEYDVAVPAGTKAGAVIEFTAADGKIIRASTPQDFPEGGTMRVRA